MKLRSIAVAVAMVGALLVVSGCYNITEGTRVKDRTWQNGHWIPDYYLVQSRVASFDYGSTLYPDYQHKSANPAASTPRPDPTLGM